MITWQHKVVIAVGGKQIGGWTEYEVEVGMLSPTGSWRLTRPVNREAWEACELDAPVTVTIDGAPVISGFIGDLQATAGEGTLTVAGRCRAGRLVQESAPGIQYAGRKMSDLVGELASSVFPKVVLSGARDRAIRRGKGYHAAAPTEPLVIDGVAGGRIEPGQMRWKVIEDLVTQAGYLARSGADGKELIVGAPNYTQEVQWAFIHATGRAGTVLDLTQSEGIEDCYSQIQVVGSKGGTDADYGTSTAERSGTWRDGDGPFGVGLDFRYPKRLVIAQHSLHSSAHGEQLATREARRRNQQRRRVIVEAPGHGQLVRGSTPTIFALDTLARVVYEPTGLDAVYLVTGCRFRGNRNDGARTQLELVPKGTELTL